MPGLRAGRHYLGEVLRPARARRYATTIAATAAYGRRKRRAMRAAAAANGVPAHGSPAASPAAARHAEALRRDGYALVPGYLPRDTCEGLAARLLALLPPLPPPPERPPDEPLPYTVSRYSRKAHLRGGGVVEWRNVDAPGGTDRGVICVYHVDEELPELAELRHDPEVAAIVAGACGRPLPSRAYKAFVNDSAVATRGFHLDQSTQDQFKSFLFLTDVVEADDGSHAYVPGTHRSTALKSLNYLRNAVDPRRQRHDMTWFPGRRAEAVTCPAGTLLLADITGFHRAMPQAPGRRRVVLNNCYDWFTYD